MRRGRILVSLLFLLFAVGVVPLLWTSYKLVSRSRDILELDQKSIQLDKARSLSQQVSTYLKSLEAQVTAIARTLSSISSHSPVWRPARISTSDRAHGVSDSARDVVPGGQ